MPGITAVIRVPGNEKQALDEKINRLEMFGAVEIGKVRLESCVYRCLSEQGLMKGVVEYDKKSYVEGTGVKYRLGDFQVSFMTIYMGQSAVIKGLLIEIGFIPTCLPNCAGDLLVAFGTQHFPELFAGTNPLTPTLKKAFTDCSSSEMLSKSTPEKLIMGDVMNVFNRASARIIAAQYIEKIREIRHHQHQ